jgi:hypothetical protein
MKDTEAAWRFAGTYSLHLQGQRVNKGRNQQNQAVSRVRSDWRRNIPPKRRTVSELHYFTNQKMPLFIVTPWGPVMQGCSFVPKISVAICKCWELQRSELGGTCWFRHRNSCVNFIYEGGLISLWLYKENNKLRDWKKIIYIFPLSSTHLWLRCSNFFNLFKKNYFGYAANRKIGNRENKILIITPTYCFTTCFGSLFLSSGKIFLLTLYFAVIFPYIGQW